jgi:DDE superfamily endonuclease
MDPAVDVAPAVDVPEAGGPVPLHPGAPEVAPPLPGPSHVVEMPMCVLCGRVLWPVGTPVCLWCVDDDDFNDEIDFILVAVAAVYVHATLERRQRIGMSDLFGEWDDHTLHVRTLMGRWELNAMFVALRMPRLVKAYGSRHSIDMRDAFLVLIAWLRMPSTHEQNSISLFGHRAYRPTKSGMSRMRNAAANVLSFLWADIVLRVPYCFAPEQLWTYTQAIASKAGLEAGVLPICGFLDGTANPIARPNSELQQAYYSGQHKRHEVRAHGLVTPDGLMAHYYGPISGAANDKGMLADSGLLKMMEHVFKLPQFLGGQGVVSVYADAGYSTSTHVWVPFVDPRRGSEEANFNKRMSAIRISNENLFAVWFQQFKGFGLKQLMRVHQIPYCQLTWVSVLLLNCLTCLRGGNQVSRYFGVRPPSLNALLDRTMSQDLQFGFSQLCHSDQDMFETHVGRGFDDDRCIPERTVV